jgi:hypothetical protein
VSRPLRGLVVLVVVLGGCGDLGTGAQTERVRQPQVVRKSDIVRHPEGSPARVFMEWWRALQFASASNAVRLYADGVKVNQERLQRHLEASAGVLGLRARPRVVDVTTRGDTATVFALFTDAELNPNGRVDKAGTPRAFDLVREGGDWKIADNRYIARTLHQARVFIEQGSKRQQPGRDSGG